MNDLQWKKFPVLDDGFVCLVDVMGNDSSVVQAARVSYGNDTRASVWDSKTGLPVSGQMSKDRGLIRYMMRNHHGTPFEMAEVKLLVRVPMDCWRQWIRHRTANVNEYSTRYTEAIDSQQRTPPDQWRLQSGSNKQGSEGFLKEWPEGVTGDERGIYLPSGPVNPVNKSGQFHSSRESQLHELSREVYEDRLATGIAKEQARKDLPLSTYTEAYWKCDLRNIFHFLGLRMDSHAQQEIREYATVIGEQIIKPLFPACWEAFEDYHLNAMHLSALDLAVIRRIDQRDPSSADVHALVAEVIQNKREQAECIAKLERMGLL